MISIRLLKDAVSDEIRIVRHLATKLAPRHPLRLTLRHKTVRFGGSYPQELLTWVRRSTQCPQEEDR